jgi:putative PIN family toxin of toxin-antitoxin system
MNVVLDTNVLVSGLLSPHRPPGRILSLLVTGRLTPCVDARILAEYREVLKRPRFSFDAAAATTLLYYVRHAGILCSAPPLSVEIPDPEDAPFLEVAVAAGAEALITGNIRHFPARARGGARVVTPAQFMADWTG